MRPEIGNLEQYKDIDHDLIGGATVQDVAGQYGASKSAVDRHRRNCLAPRIANAIARHEELSHAIMALRGKPFLPVTRASTYQDILTSAKKLLP